jgi:K+-transporting ATPase ATPase A chain
MSYLTQMLGLTLQNFVSAATGMAVLVAFVRGFQRVSSDTIGNFWVDVVRSTLYVLLPLSFVLASCWSRRASCRASRLRNGVARAAARGRAAEARRRRPAALDAAGKPVTTSTASPNRRFAVGPAASQIAIKQLGTNGGGFFNVNSAHPLENPTPLSNFLELLAILLIPAALCYTFGALVKDTRQGWAVLAAMTVVFVGLLGVGVLGRERRQSGARQLGADHDAKRRNPAATWKARKSAMASRAPRSGRSRRRPRRTAP